MLSQYLRSGVGLVVCGFSPYATEWQTALTGGLKEPTCERTNTNLCVLYLLLACTRPPESDRYTYKRKSRPQDRMSKSRTKSPTVAEDEEKISTVENEKTNDGGKDEKTNAGVTTSEHSLHTNSVLGNWALSNDTKLNKERADVWIKYYGPMDMTFEHEVC